MVLTGALRCLESLWGFIFVEEVSKTDDSYLGYERWLPSPPKVQKPRSIFNAAALAYLGDGIYEVCYLLNLFSAIQIYQVILGFMGACIVIADMDMPLMFNYSA